MRTLEDLFFKKAVSIKIIIAINSLPELKSYKTNIVRKAKISQDYSKKIFDKLEQYKIITKKEFGIKKYYFLTIKGKRIAQKIREIKKIIKTKEVEQFD